MSAIKLRYIKHEVCHLTNLEIHELQELINLRSQHLNGPLIYVNPVWLFIGPGLRYGTAAATPRVQHDSVGVPFFQELVLETDMINEIDICPKVIRFKWQWAGHITHRVNRSPTSQTNDLSNVAGMHGMPIA